MISESRAADVIEYLADAGAALVTETKAAVWADYLNAHVPDVPHDQLLLATRLSLARWVEAGGRWQLTVHHVVQAVWAVRADRVRRAGSITPPDGMSPAREVAWLREVRQLIGDGADKTAAIRTVNAAYGVEPPRGGVLPMPPWFNGRKTLLPRSVA